MPDAYRKKLATLRDNEHPFAQYVRILGKGKTGSRSLTEEEALEAMRMALKGEVEDIQLGAFLMLLRVKEESPAELSGFVRAVRETMQTPATSIHADLDWSSYAGKKRQLPWFVLSCLLLAENGIKVFMHGASGHTIGRIYTEDFLPAIGLPVASDWQQVQRQLEISNFSFIPLRRFSPALNEMINFRNYLGLRSPVHTLARLINPLEASYSIQSIFHPAYADSHQQASLLLQQANSAVFKGEGGEVERKPEAACLVKQLRNGQACEEQWPKMLEGRQPQPEVLDPQHLLQVWQGKIDDHYGEMAVIGTTALALKLMQKADSQEDALALANEYWQQRQRQCL